MEKQNKISSFFAKVGAFFVTVGKTIARWFMRLFFPNRELMKERKKQELENENLTEEEREERARKMDVEEIVTPFQQYVRGFKEHKMAVAALIIVILMFVFVFVGPLFFPTYTDSYTETTQQNIAPGFRMMNVPKKLANNVKMISGYGTFTVGLSNDGEVFIWGETELGTSKIDISEIPDEVQNANIEWIAAGYDHVIAIDDEGNIYAWGNDTLGQYGMKPTDDTKVMANSIYMSKSLWIEGVGDHGGIKKVECGYQVTGILMNDGTLYLWGNSNSIQNLAAAVEYAKTNKAIDFAFTKNDMVIITDEGKLWTGMKNRYTDLVSLVGAEKYGETTEMKVVSKNNKIVSVAAASSTVCFIFEDHSVWFSGDFPIDSVENPTLEEGEYYISIDGGSQHYTGLTNKGNIYSFGGNVLGQCKTKQAKNADLTNGKVYTGSYQNYIVDSNGKLVVKFGHSGYLFGTDTNGASIFQRLLNGGKMTMTIGAVAVIISTIIGILIGCISGYFGGKVDILLMRLAEIVSAIPFLPFAMILSALMTRVSISDNLRIFIIMVILGVLTWPGLAHMVRGQVLVVRENEYVTAAKAMGVKESTIAFKHILPNVISIIIVSLTLDFAGCMLTESSLSYLGFGVQLPKPTWGNMLNKANNSTIIQNFWWQWFFPALFLAITTICINMVGDALRDVMDPKSTADR